MIPEAFALALEHHAAGRLQAAEQLYRQILEAEPNQAEAIHLLGVIAHQRGQHAVAVATIGRAIESNPAAPAFHSNLGSAYRALGKLPEAVACYHRALVLQPNYPEVQNNLGNALQEQGKPDEAVACYHRALELKPDYAEAHSNLANALTRLRKLDEAVTHYRRALQLRPDYPQAHGNLGHALREQGKLDEAVAHCRRAVELKPDYAEAYNNLGNALRDLDRLDEAIACGRRAVELNPAMADAHNNLGNALKDLGKLDEAIGYFHRALELDPEFAEAHNNLGNVQKEQGNLDEAIACFRRAVELKPDYVEAHSNWLCAMLYSADYAPDAIYREHLRWNERFAAPLAGAIQPHDNDRTPERRLRIGYLSPDFRNHVVALFLLPLLEAHDRGQVEIFCYASVRARDDVTERCRAKADVWRDVFNLSDEQLASMMRQDRIDILVDLAMHTAGSRLLAFARKPAPVQVTYLAYCGTTGMSTIDYRLTDPYLDPPGADERFYSERSIRLPETYWCYRPIVDAPPVNPLPALQNGYITFACFNNFCKVTPPTLAAWRQLLQRVPNSRLLVHAHEGSHRQRVREFIAQEGVSHERITFAGKVPTSAYLRAHQQIDVALDPFPYGGGTTTCDALWMGVPVVSLRGQTAVGRGGASILSNVGLPELVADDIGQYVRIAAELAEDLPRLSKLRTALRERMQHSPLMNAPRFARHVEAAYRTMWQRWCDESNRC